MAREYAAVILVIGLGILLSLTAFFVSQQQLQAHRQLEFEWVARERIRAVYHEIGGVLQAVEAIRDHYRVADRLEQEDFRLIARSLNERYLGVQSLAWVPRVPHDRLQGYHQAGPSDGGMAGPILEWAPGGGTQPAAEREIHFPVEHLEPAAADTFPTGFDMAAAPVFRAVLDRARDRGDLAVSGRVPLGRGGGGHYGFVACVPVFRRGEPVDTVDQRRRQLSGFAVGVFRLDDLARASISRLKPRGVDVAVLDESADPGDRLLEFYASRLGPGRTLGTEQELASLLRAAPLHLTENFDVADRRWSITAVGSPLFISAEAFAQGPAVVLLAGLLFTGLVGYYLVRMRSSMVIRRGMEAALRDREALYREMTETMDEVLWAIDPTHNRFLYLSPACTAVLAGSCDRFRDDVAALTTQVHAADRQRLAAVARRLLEERSDAEVEFRLLCENGEWRWIRTRAFPVADARGEVYRVVGLSEDITSRKLADEALRKSERKLRTLFNQSPDIIMMVGSDGAVLLINRPIAGLLADPTQGGPSELLVPPEFRERYRLTLDKALRAGRIGHFRYTLADGTWWEVRMVPVKQSKRVKGAMVIAADVTEQQVLRDQATRSARLASIGALSAGVAHEVNNPNNAILFNASLFRRAWQDALPILDAYYREHGDYALGGLPFTEFRDTSVRLLQDMVGNSERIRRIVDNLKHLARREGEQVDQQVDVNEVLRETAMILHHPIQQHTNDFTMELAADLPWVTGNSQLLEQLFINLVLNALQSLPDKGRTVRVSSTVDRARRWLSVKVIDQGVGIAEHDRVRLTEPFFTTRGEVGGTGLGLSIAKSIVERHHGSLLFDSQPGLGTTVTVRLPVVGRTREP